MRAEMGWWSGCKLPGSTPPHSLTIFLNEVILHMWTNNLLQKPPGWPDAAYVCKTLLAAYNNVLAADRPCHCLFDFIEHRLIVLNLPRTSGVTTGVMSFAEIVSKPCLIISQWTDPGFSLKTLANAYFITACDASELGITNAMRNGRTYEIVLGHDIGITPALKHCLAPGTYFPKFAAIVGSNTMNLYSRIE